MKRIERARAVYLAFYHLSSNGIKHTHALVYIQFVLFCSGFCCSFVCFEIGSHCIALTENTMKTRLASYSKLLPLPPCAGTEGAQSHT